MSIRRRKKAIGKVVKLLNLATSTNSSESSMALRHAESIIFQNGLSQGEIPMYQLCDRAMLFKVSWNGTPRHAKVERPTAHAESYAQRRFSEKPTDSSRTYANARTILDDLDEEFAQAAEHCSADGEASMGSSEDIHAEAAYSGPDQTEEAPVKEHGSLQDEGDTGDDVVSEAPYADDEAFSETMAEQEESPFAGPETEACSEQPSTDFSENTMNAADENLQTSEERVYSYDNVINAANAFRPTGEQFKETLRNQYSSSNPDVPFEQDSYWNKVHSMLVDFDESDVLVEIDGLESQLELAQQALQAKRSERASVEQEELRERTERARIEQSFEEAIERAFQARARAYEAWESKRAQMRVDSMRAEQDAQQGYSELSDRLQNCKEQYAQHLQLKEDYRAAKIMHELRRHLTLAARGDEQASASYETVISIMQDSGLSLRDLEFSDIRNKSLFIRLLERESALIADVHQRELYTEEMLDKFLMMSRQEQQSKPSENPIERVERLLKSIEGVGHFESQKVIEQVLKLMEHHQVSVRDLDYGCINKYSVFICLINWEAEQIHSLTEREKFTSSILEEYVQYSVMNPRSSQKA
ncbi:hypothetical protein MAQ5080_02461 [Marinomonas aquimarina]|uniref:Uncharacterized protein n=1 Tax=Marinomonas aquimarina TaxID=295068 RepID=A0A1A8TJP9_9GAMM|nr:DUF2786 domain-containing protein [Marinomonas aquimarina]SBS33098.1 hypothetical protein MAQ5080_02461 [Marinomonas aquimarina]